MADVSLRAPLPHASSCYAIWCRYFQTNRVLQLNLANYFVFGWESCMRRVIIFRKHNKKNYENLLCFWYKSRFFNTLNGLDKSQTFVSGSATPQLFSYNFFAKYGVFFAILQGTFQTVRKTELLTTKMLLKITLMTNTEKLNVLILQKFKPYYWVL